MMVANLRGLWAPMRADPVAYLLPTGVSQSGHLRLLQHGQGPERTNVLVSSETGARWTGVSHPCQAALKRHGQATAKGKADA